MHLKRIAAAVALVLLCWIVFARAMGPIANVDFGWHVALGRWMLEHGEVPDREPFTYTARGAPMVAHEWMSQWIYAAVIETAGLGALRVAHALLALVLVLLLYGCLRKLGTTRSLALLGVVLWLVIAAGRFQLRPHMINLLFALSGYAALFVLRPRLSAPQLAAAFGFVVLWANLHSGALLGVAVTGLYAGLATVGQRVLGQAARPDELGQDRLGRLWLLVCLVAAAIVFTPNELRVLPYLAESARINSELSVEWRSLVSSVGLASRSVLVLACIAGLVVAALATAWWRRREIPIARLGLPLSLAALPLVSGQRFSWTLFAAIAFVLPEISRSLLRARGGVGVAAVVVAIAASSALGVAELPWQSSFRKLSLGNDFRSVKFPIAALDLLEQVDLEGRLFTPNKWGGFVLYRSYDRYPVFVDGRWVTIGEQVIRDAHRIAHRLVGTRALLDAYRVEILLVHRGWMTEELRRADGWIPACANFNSGVYLRPGSASAANLQRLADHYRSVGVPFDPVTGFDEQRVAEANPEWAHRFGVRRIHLDQFGHHGLRAGEVPRRVPGW